MYNQFLHGLVNQVHKLDELAYCGDGELHVLLNNVVLL